MKPAIAILLSILACPPALSAGDDLSVEKAIEILNGSLNKRERGTALGALLKAKEKALPAAAVLGRIIATDPNGDEASLAAEALGHLGKAGIPIVVALVANGFDYSYVCGTRVVRRFSPELEADLIAAMEPALALRTAVERFNGILTLGFFPLSRESANRLTRAQLDDVSYTSKLGGALFLAPKANAPSLLADIEAHPYKSMKYLGARLREEWRRRDSPILRQLRMQHAPQPVPDAEQERCRVAEASLAGLATAAFPEAIEQLKRAHDVCEKFLWMEVIRTLSEHAPPPRDSVLEALAGVWRERGSLIDVLLAKYHSKILTGRQ